MGQHKCSPCANTHNTQHSQQQRKSYDVLQQLRVCISTRRWVVFLLFTRNYYFFCVKTALFWTNTSPLFRGFRQKMESSSIMIVILERKCLFTFLFLD